MGKNNFLAREEVNIKKRLQPSIHRGWACSPMFTFLGVKLIYVKNIR